MKWCACILNHPVHLLCAHLMPQTRTAQVLAKIEPRVSCGRHSVLCVLCSEELRLSTLQLNTHSSSYILRDFLTFSSCQVRACQNSSRDLDTLLPRKYHVCSLMLDSVTQSCRHSSVWSWRYLSRVPLSSIWCCICFVHFRVHFSHRSSVYICSVEPVAVTLTLYFVACCGCVVCGTL